MKHLSLISLATYLPEKIVDNSTFIGLNDNNSSMFKGSKSRHHIAKGQKAEEMFALAAEKLFSEIQNINVDTIITNVSLPDLPFTGCGAMLANKLKLKPKRIYDLHNGGCVSFILMMDLARSLINTHDAKRILICTAQTAAGRIFAQEEIIKKAQSAIPGDGASVALFSCEGDSPIEHIKVNCFPEYASDMGIFFEDNHEWWEPSMSPGSISFDEQKIAKIFIRGNRLVPEVMYEILWDAKLLPADISTLITNQPNPIFLRNWREALPIAKENHFETFETLGNLFQAGIPINLDLAIRTKKIQKDSKILLAGFSHAGDYSGGAIIHWKKAIV